MKDLIGEKNRIEKSLDFRGKKPLEFAKKLNNKIQVI